MLNYKKKGSLKSHMLYIAMPLTESGMLLEDLSVQMDVENTR